ncbi:serine-rich adhesin for platelets [Rhagoletis pomonella]|uniref:serine-rich adhesin for platelets n=1 Tax=Rhagoletis pomonella TaxID=28610 RepID=UPI00177AAACA|nr:serine-rich adhesin for platelets [Rhagoletis pomonella]XP_036323614.1 serine-rich adhesin for platelets [Rhagoletis pomonella]XP_036323615.1 serine-rich adhesin for platelets [Rhagoletis pomonella]XP_036323616.1 serine-rich adhesin for platelets [Rhagoletis pomonella]
MWKCHKCGKPVYFAERKQSLGYDWHPECLRCEECGKRLNPGQHAEHKGVPYCHVPCYGALFGPQLFGHGTRVESHKSYGVKGTQRSGIGIGGPVLPRDHLESKLKVYNQFYDNKSMEIRSREVNNRLILEGALRVSWGVHGVIHLKEDDDQRMIVVRKRNSKRISKAAEDSPSDKENDVSESLGAPTTTSEVENLSTDISLSESMTFDSCSLNEYPLTDLPTTPEEASANTTGTTDGAAVPLINGANGSANDEKSESTSTLCGTDTTITTASTSCVSTTLPSKLDNLDKLEWDEIDDLLQVERRISEKDKIYETMPVKLPSSQTSSSESSPSKTISAHNLTESTNTTSEVPSPSTPTSASTTNNNSNSNSEGSSTSSDNFVTATSATINSSISGTTSTTTTTTVDNFESSDDATLKPMDYEEFKRSVHLDYVNGANSFRDPNEDSLKRNQPIDPSRIHDSLKLYGESAMSKSFNCEHALRSIDANLINDTLHLKSGTASPHSIQRMYALQKSGSASTATGGNHQNLSPYHQRYQNFDKGINRSKSGPSCFDYSDSDDDSTLKPQQSATIRRSDVPSRYVKIEMDCYPKERKKKDDEKESVSEADSSRTEAPSITVTNSGTAGGDELTQTEDMVTASEGRGLGVAHNVDDDDADPPLHVTEDGVVLRRPPRTGAAAIKRRSGNRRSRTKLKRRCSINGHFYNRETSFFTPPYGSQMSVWVTSLVTTTEVINLLLEKYKVDSAPENFSLFIVRDNGEQKRLKETDYPLVTRVMMGPHEDVARLFLVDAKKTDEISNEVAQFINLSLPECRAILERYDDELEREVAKVRERYIELRRRIINRMESLKVHL